MMNIFAILLHARIAGKLEEWVIMIDPRLLLKTIDAKSSSIKLMAASAEPRSSLLTYAATNSCSVLVQS